MNASISVSFKNNCVLDTGNKNPCRYKLLTTDNAFVGNAVGASDRLGVGALVSEVFLGVDTVTLKRIVGCGVGAVFPGLVVGNDSTADVSSSPYTK